MSDFDQDGNYLNGNPENSPTSPDPDTVRLIVAEINQGNEDAWKKLTKQINSYLTVMARKDLPEAIRGQMNPSDIVQQTMMEVVQGIDGFRGQSTAEFYGWLNQILKNQARRAARDLTRQKRDVRREVLVDGDKNDSRQKLDVPDDVATPGSQAIISERLELMEQALSLLPTEYEQVVRWRNLEHMSYEQIAEKLDRSVGAVSKLWYRAMVKLRQELESLENETKQ